MPASAARKSRQVDRAEFVRGQLLAFVEYASSSLSLKNFKDFAASAEAKAHEASRKLTEHYKDSEEVLTQHADHVRCLSSYIVLLRDGLVPAMEIDSENLNHKREAAYAFAFIRAEILAMDSLMV